ncbi:ABC transporter permease [Fredinandcohnia humi]
METKLFFTRLRSEIDYQWKVFRSVVDWTIFLYIFIPALAFVGYNYYIWWTQTPTWFEGITIQLVLGILYLICWQGRIRTFLEAADQLFFIQKRSLVITLKKQTRNLYVLGYSIGIISILMLLAPFLVHQYSFSFIELLILGFYFCSLKALILVIKQYLDDTRSSWKRNLSYITLFLALGTYSVVSLSLVILAFSYAALLLGMIHTIFFYTLSTKRIHQLTTFTNDIYHDKKEKLKYMKFIFFFSEYVEKVPEQRKKDPFFYKNSKRIFKQRNPEKALKELYLKVFFRNKGYILQYLQIIGVTTSALLVIPPLWIKLIFYLGFSIIIRVWLRVIYKKTLSNHFITMIRKDDIVRIQTEGMIVNAFSIPVICMVGIVLILQSIL